VSARRLSGSLLLLVAVAGTSTGCGHGNRSVKKAPPSGFTNLASANAAVHAKLERRFRRPLGRVDCSIKWASSPDHLFCLAYGPGGPDGTEGWGPDGCSAQGFDAWRHGGVVVLRDAVEDYYCIRNVKPGSSG
jgi:hypothetical protein